MYEILAEVADVPEVKSVTREQLDAVYHRFTELADRKKAIYDQDLIGLLVHDAVREKVSTLAH